MQTAGFDSIGEVLLSFDETWDSDSRRDLLDAFCRRPGLPRITANRFGQVKVVLQGREDVEWNAFAQTLESQGVRNTKHCVVYRMERNKAYLVDESGKRTEHHAEYHDTETGGSAHELLPRDQVIRWFRWIP